MSFPRTDASAEKEAQDDAADAVVAGERRLTSICAHSHGRLVTTGSAPPSPRAYAAAMRRLELIASILFLAALPALAGRVPTTVTIDAAAKKQPAVPFSHDKHTKYAKACDVCHHNEKGLTADSKVEVKKCSTCHLDPKSKAPSMGDSSLTKNPFHTKCIACHKEQKKGPTACTGCHIKKK